MSPCDVKWLQITACSRARPHFFPSFTLIRPTLLDLPNSELLERVTEANNISLTGTETE